MGDDCATGVASPATRRPARTCFYGEFLINAQGEDVVAGIRTPLPMAQLDAKPGKRSMEVAMPDAYQELVEVSASSRSTTRTCRTSSSRSRRTSSTCCRPATASAPPPRPCRSPSTWRGEADRPRPRRSCGSTRPSLDQLLHPTLDPKAPSKLLSARACRPARARPAARSPSRAEEAESARRQGREDHPRPQRDQPRGHRRHARRRGHPDHQRRHDQPRGGRRPRHGQALRRRRRRLSIDDDRPERCSAGGKDACARGEIITLDGAHRRGLHRRRRRWSSRS